jgi:membrane protein
LGRFTFWQIARTVVNEIITNNIFGKAAELAFYFLFALFPLLLIMLTLFGLAASDDVELQSRLFSWFSGALPPAAFQVLYKVAGELAEHASGGKLTFGVVSALWFVSSAVGAMTSSVNSAHHVPETRSWIRFRALMLLLSGFISTLLFLAFLMGMLANHLARRIGIGLGVHPVGDALWGGFRWLVAVAFITGICSLIYYSGPDLRARRRWHWLTPGSIVGTLIWLLASVGFRIYLEFFNTYSASYGSLGAVMILLAWLYVAALAYLIGVQINAEIARGVPTTAR